MEQKAFFELLDRTDELLRIRDLKMIYRYMFIYNANIKIKNLKDNKYQVILTSPDGKTDMPYEAITLSPVKI